MDKKKYIETLEYVFIITTIIYVYFIQAYKQSSMYAYLHFSNHMAVRIVVAVAIVALAVVSPIFSLCLMVGYITTLIEYKRQKKKSPKANENFKLTNNIDNMYVPMSNDVSHPADSTITENLHKTGMEVISPERLSGVQGDVNMAFDKYGDGLFTNPNNIPIANDNDFNKTMLLG